MTTMASAFAILDSAAATAPLSVTAERRTRAQETGYAGSTLPAPAGALLWSAFGATHARMTLRLRSPGWVGPSCALPCPGGPKNPCSSHGQCVPAGEAAQCVCTASNSSVYSAYAASDCSIAVVMLFLLPLLSVPPPFLKPPSVIVGRSRTRPEYLERPWTALGCLRLPARGRPSRSPSCWPRPRCAGAWCACTESGCASSGPGRRAWRAAWRPSRPRGSSRREAADRGRRGVATRIVCARDDSVTGAAEPRSGPAGRTGRAPGPSPGPLQARRPG